MNIITLNKLYIKVFYDKMYELNGLYVDKKSFLWYFINGLARW